MKYRIEDQSLAELLMLLLDKTNTKYECEKHLEHKSHGVGGDPFGYLTSTTVTIISIVD